jgi:acetyl-CoA carboxylase carboxyltransferase component
MSDVKPTDRESTPDANGGQPPEHDPSRDLPAPDHDATAELRERAAKIRAEMGGTKRIDAIHAEGRWTAREHIDALLDDGSFREHGTFAVSERPEDRETTPGEGKIAGRGKVEGRGIAVVADDATVKRASTSIVSARKVHQMFDAAIRDGQPLVYFGETGGARIPDIMGSENFTLMPPPDYVARRGRRVPMVSVITGESFGASSFYSATSDLTIQLPGTCLAITSPRVIEFATGQKISMEELGGPEVHAKTTGQIDLTAEDPAHASRLVREFLSYLPSNNWTPPPRAVAIDPPDVDLEQIVPAARRRAWNVKKLIAGVADEGSTFELMPDFGKSVVTSLARLGGRPVGFVASQPMVQAGVLGPDACDKATRFICLCDAYGLPLVFLHDTPGFMVGTGVEHRRLLHKAMMMWQAVSLAEVPKLAVIVRKSYGVADYAMAGIGMRSDLLVAWPRAEIGFMDPDTAANVLFPGTEEEDVAARTARAEEIALDIGPLGAAGAMRVDEVIEPATTPAVLRAALDDLDGRPFRSGSERTLATWPTSW